MHPIAGANISVTRVPIAGFLVQSIMEVHPTVALLEADAYTVVEVPEAVAVRTHASNYRY